MPSTPPPAMPPGFAEHGINNEFDEELEEAAAQAAPSSSEVPSIAQLMAFMVLQPKQMAEMMLTYRAGRGQHLANAKLDDRNFKRIEKFNNKRDSWKEWKLHFTTCIKECDTPFADFIWGIEKRTDEICFITLAFVYPHWLHIVSFFLVPDTVKYLGLVVWQNESTVKCLGLAAWQNESIVKCLGLAT